MLAMSPERSGIRVGSDNTCDRSLTMAKAYVSQPVGLVICEEWASLSELWTLKSPRLIIPERGE